MRSMSGLRFELGSRVQKARQQEDAVGRPPMRLTPADSPCFPATGALLLRSPSSEDTGLQDDLPGNFMSQISAHSRAATQ